jgi:RNA recognition motif-containing protein
MGKRLYIGNLSYNVTELDLRDLFSGVGSVAEVKVVMDRETGRPRGFAFVEMTSDADAQNAISQLNGRDVQGRAIAVKEAEARKDGGGRGHGGGGGGGGWAGGGGGGGGRRQRW